MVAHKPIRVRAKRGHFVALRAPASMSVRYIGRAYDQSGDSTNLESEFPIVNGGEIVQSVEYIRKAIADGELELCVPTQEGK